MKAFHGNEKIKEKYLARVNAHALADEIVKGKYWEDGKGCAVGCTIHSPNHASYESELGIPEWLARVEDIIFEGLPNDRAKAWPVEFLSAINIGSDLDRVKAPFLIFVLGSTLDKFNHKKFPKVKKAVEDVILLYQSNEKDLSKFRAVWAATATAYAATAAAAYAAATADAYAYATAAAATAAAAAADAACAATAAAAAADTAYAAATAAAHAADTAYAAATAAAAYAAATADAADAACAAARFEAFVKFADKLLELIKDAACDVR